MYPFEIFTLIQINVETVRVQSLRGTSRGLFARAFFRILRRNMSKCCPNCKVSSCSTMPIDCAQLFRPKCDRYGCLIPLVPKSSDIRLRPITKLGYDSCQMPMILRQRCPCCLYREIPDMCCSRASKYPNPCRYAEINMHHLRLYGDKIYRFEGACRF